MPNIVPFDLEKIQRAKATVKDDEKSRAYLADCKYTAKRDKFYLSKLLGYYFQLDVHADLFAQYVPFDDSKSLFDQSPIKHRLTLWSRNFYKSTSIVVEIVQMILNFPDVSIMLMQSTVQNTKKLLQDVKGHFDGSNHDSHLELLFPKFCKEKLGTQMSFTVPARSKFRRDPTVFIASPKSTKAGLHPDVGFFDDLVTEINYKNKEVMDKVIVDFSHYTPLINPGGYFYVTGTRYTFGDLYEHIMREEADRVAKGEKRWQITKRGCWRYENGQKVSNFPPRFDPVAGKVIGISVAELEAIQQENPETFSAQYMNEPIAASKQEFTEALLVSAIRPRDPHVPVDPAILFVDLAEGTSDGSDNRVIACGRRVMGIPTVCDIRSGQWPTLEIASNIMEMALQHRPMRVLIEGSPGSTYFIDYLKMVAKDKGLSLPIDKIKTSNNKGAKNLRISAVAGAIKTNRLKFLVDCCPGAPKGPTWAKLVEQFIQFPKGKHDDEIDTIALMVQFYSGQIGTFDPMPAANLPFFLRQPGVDFSFEKKLVESDDSYSLVPIPEPIF